MKSVTFKASALYLTRLYDAFRCSSCTGGGSEMKIFHAGSTSGSPLEIRTARSFFIDQALVPVLTLTLMLASDMLASHDSLGSEVRLQLTGLCRGWHLDLAGGVALRPVQLEHERRGLA